MQNFKNNTVLYQDDCIKLHKHTNSGDCGSVFVVPPHAGRHGNIAQNMIDALAGNGYQVYWYELLPATHQSCSLSVYGLVQKLRLCVHMISGAAISIAGICQGGWLAAIYASLYPESVRRLALFAAPINTHTGENNSIEDYCKTASMFYHKMVVACHGGIQPGYMQWLAFALANPVPVFYDKYVEKFKHIMANDFSALEKWEKNNDWYNHSVDLHGSWFLEALEHHFINNELYEGNWDLGSGVTPNLSNITCPISVYAGANDEITHPEQARGILDKVASYDTNFTIFPNAGHTATFVRNSCVQQFIDDWSN